MSPSVDYVLIGSPDVMYADEGLQLGVRIATPGDVVGLEDWINKAPTAVGVDVG